MYKYIYIYIYMYIYICHAGIVKLAVWKSECFHILQTISQHRLSDVLLSEVNFIQLYVSKPNVYFLFTLKSCPFLNTSVLFSFLHRDKKCNMEYNGVSNWREVCRPCLPSPLAGFVWDTISGVATGLPLHCRDPTDALTSCMKECGVRRENFIRITQIPWNMKKNRLWNKKK